LFDSLLSNNFNVLTSMDFSYNSIEDKGKQQTNMNESSKNMNEIKTNT